jgi:hypothetical protein
VDAITAEEGAQPFVATSLMEGGKQVPPLNTSTTAGKDGRDLGRAGVLAGLLGTCMDCWCLPSSTPFFT